MALLGHVLKAKSGLHLEDPSICSLTMLISGRSQWLIPLTPTTQHHWAWDTLPGGKGGPGLPCPKPQSLFLAKANLEVQLFQVES